jgi:hypothetical protein
MTKTEGGVSFWDTRIAAEELGRLYHCLVHFELHLPMRRSLDHSWQVRAIARWYDERGKVSRERGEGSPWPTTEAKTFAGLELLLLHRLERKITDEIADEARSSVLQGRLF